MKYNEYIKWRCRILVIQCLTSDNYRLGLNGRDTLKTLRGKLPYSSAAAGALWRFFWFRDCLDKPVDGSCGSLVQRG